MTTNQRTAQVFDQIGALTDHTGNRLQRGRFAVFFQDDDSLSAYFNRTGEAEPVNPLVIQQFLDHSSFAVVLVCKTTDAEDRALNLLVISINALQQQEPDVPLKHAIKQHANRIIICGMRQSRVIKLVDGERLVKYIQDQRPRIPTCASCGAGLTRNDDTCPYCNITI